MDTVTLQVTLPRQFLLSLGLTDADAVTALKKALVLQLVRDNHVSAGKAAELLGLSKYAFIQLMAQQNVPYFSFTKEELDEELKNLDG